jgi:hypothetical protein
MILRQYGFYMISLKFKYLHTKTYIMDLNKIWLDNLLNRKRRIYRVIHTRVQAQHPTQITFHIRFLLNVI